MLPLAIREADSLNYILSSWKASAYDQQSVLAKGNFYALANLMCAGILDGDPVLLVATPPDMPDVILGWVCAEATPEAIVLWYANTKAAYRKAGISARLLDAAVQMCQAEGAGPGRVFAFSGRFDKLMQSKGWSQMSIARAMHLRQS